MRRTLEISALIAVAILAAMAFHAWLASHDEQLRMQATIATQKQLIDAADGRERDRATALNQTLAEIEKLKRDVQTPQQILSDLPKYLSLPQPITLTPTPVTTTKSGIATRWFGGRKGSGVAANGSPDDGPSNAPDESAGASSDTLESPAKSSNRPPSGYSSAQSAAAASSVPARSEGLPTAANESKHSALSVNQGTQVTPPAQIPASDLRPLYDYVQNCRSCQAQLAAAKQSHTDDAAKLAAMTSERDAALTSAKGGTFWRRFSRNIEWFAIGAAAGTAGVCATGHCR